MKIRHCAIAALGTMAFSLAPLAPAMAAEPWQFGLGAVFAHTFLGVAALPLAIASAVAAQSRDDRGYGPQQSYAPPAAYPPPAYYTAPPAYYAPPPAVYYSPRPAYYPPAPRNYAPACVTIASNRGGAVSASFSGAAGGAGILRCDGFGWAPLAWVRSFAALRMTA